MSMVLRFALAELRGTSAENAWVRGHHANAWERAFEDAMTQCRVVYSIHTHGRMYA